MVTRIVAAGSLVVSGLLVGLVFAARSDVASLEAEVRALKEAKAAIVPTAQDRGGGGPLSETRVREVALKMEPALTRVGELETEVRELRKSIDRIGRALGELAASGDGASGRDLSDPVAILTSDDPRHKEVFKKAVVNSLRSQRDERWSQRLERIGVIDAEIVGQVAKQQNWPQSRTEEVKSIVKDFRAEFRQAMREARRGEQTPVDAEKKLDAVVNRARDRLVQALGAFGYEAYRTTFNQNADALARVRAGQLSPKLPPAR